MIRNTLIVLWSISFIFELVLTLGGFIDPAMMLSQFHVAVTPDTLFLAHVLALCFALVTALIAGALYSLMKKQQNYWFFAYTISIWWIFLGPSLYLKFGRIESLFLDTAKGLLLFLFSYLLRKNSPRFK